MKTINSEQFILIEIGGIDPIVTSPNYGKPIMNIEVRKIPPEQALLMLNQLSTSLIGQLSAEKEHLQKRVHDLTKISIDNK